jgi:hypothetical protein
MELASIGGHGNSSNTAPSSKTFRDELFLLLNANVVCRDFDVFKTNIVSLSHIL